MAIKETHKHGLSGLPSPGHFLHTNFTIYHLHPSVPTLHPLGPFSPNSSVWGLLHPPFPRSLYGGSLLLMKIQLKGLFSGRDFWWCDLKQTLSHQVPLLITLFPFLCSTCNYLKVSCPCFHLFMVYLVRWKLSQENRDLFCFVSTASSGPWMVSGTQLSAGIICRIEKNEGPSGEVPRPDPSETSALAPGLTLHVWALVSECSKLMNFVFLRIQA